MWWHTRRTIFRLSAKWSSPLKLAGASVQSNILAADVGTSTVVMLDTPCSRGSVKNTGYPLHSPVSPSLPLMCVTVCHHISTGLYFCVRLQKICSVLDFGIPKRPSSQLSFVWCHGRTQAVWFLFVAKRNNDFVTDFFFTDTKGKHVGAKTVSKIVFGWMMKSLVCMTKQDAPNRCSVKLCGHVHWSGYGYKINVWSTPSTFPSDKTYKTIYPVWSKHVLGD